MSGRSVNKPMALHWSAHVAWSVFFRVIWTMDHSITLSRNIGTALCNTKMHRTSLKCKDEACLKSSSFLCTSLYYGGALVHGVWKSQKKSHSTLQAKRATFSFWVDKSELKMPKMVHFGEFLKTWSLRSNSVTRQVSFNRTKIGGKCQNSKIQMRHFQ